MPGVNTIRAFMPCASVWRGERPDKAIDLIGKPLAMRERIRIFGIADLEPSQPVPRLLKLHLVVFEHGPDQVAARSDLAHRERPIRRTAALPSTGLPKLARS